MNLHTYTLHTHTTHTHTHHTHTHTHVSQTRNHIQTKRQTVNVSTRRILPCEEVILATLAVGTVLSRPRSRAEDRARYNE